MGEISARDRAAAARRGWMFDRSLQQFNRLHVGDAVSVQLVSSSWTPYDGDPYKSPRTTQLFVLVRAPERVEVPDYDGTPGVKITAEVIRADGRQAATLLLRPTGEFGNSIILQRRNREGHHTTGSWVWLDQAVPLATRRLEPRNPLSWAHEFALSGASDLAGRIYGYVVRGGQLAELAEELQARTVPNQRGQGESSPREAWKVGAALRALELRHPALEMARATLFRAAGLSRSGLCKGAKAVPALLAVHGARTAREGALAALAHGDAGGVAGAEDAAQRALDAAQQCAGARTTRALAPFARSSVLGLEGRRAALNAAPIGSLIAVGGTGVVKAERRGQESWRMVDSAGRPKPHPTSRRLRKRDLFLLDRLVRTRRQLRVVSLGTGVLEMDSRGGVEGELAAREGPIEFARLEAALLLVDARRVAVGNGGTILQALLAANPALSRSAAEIGAALAA